jgi:thiol-disulfide isomerase/thioredoxin
MIKHFLLLSTLLPAVIFSGCSSTKPVQPMKTPINQLSVSVEGDPMLVGRIDRSGLSASPFSTWFDTEFANYTVNTVALRPVLGKTSDITVEVFMGTWCEDSQREVPRFLKIFEYMKGNPEQLKLYALDNHPDRYKTSPQGEEKGKDITLVPTFIFYRAGVELGRITESPGSSLEEDMTAILNKP